MTFKRFNFRYKRFRRRLGPRVFSSAVWAVVAAMLAHYLGPLLPHQIVNALKDLDVQPILASLAGTMLTISTFSLSIVVTANFNAVSSTTARAFKLLLDDQGTQAMLGRFLGAFVFSTMTLMILPLGYYGGGGRVILLFFTVWIEITIVISFIRWVLIIRELGSMSNALGKIETATSSAIESYLSDPFYGCNPLVDDAALGLDKMTPLYLDQGEYIQLIDEKSLNDTAISYGIEIYINLIEGDFVSAARPLVYVKGQLDEAIQYQITRNFVLGDWRDVSEDPSFGLLMLYQTASKALSPGINDPGTANDCIHTAYRLFKMWHDDKEGAPILTKVWKRPINYDFMLASFFDPITHDAGDVISIHLNSLQALAALHNQKSETVREAASREAKRVFERAILLLDNDQDKETLRLAFAKIRS